MRPTTWLITSTGLALGLLAPAIAFGQRVEIERPESPEVTTSTGGESTDPNADESSDQKETSGEDSKTGNESGTKASSNGSRRIPRFEDVRVKRMRPGELPPPISNDIPSVLKNGSGNLPSPPSTEQLDQTTERVRRRVFEVVAIQQPKVPESSSEIIHRGHAVWLSKDSEARPPVLLTTYFWLSDASEIFLVPREEDIDTMPTSEVPSAETRSLSDVTVSPGGGDWLDEHRDDLVSVRLYKPDEHRNLVVLVPESTDRLELKMPPLALLDFKRETPVRLYGYSPRQGSELVQTRIPSSHPDHEALAYYLQTPFGAPFGAPIVDAEGRVLALTAFLHPEDAERALVVPPAPIETYLDEVQSIDP